MLFRRDSLIWRLRSVCYHFSLRSSNLGIWSARCTVKVHIEITVLDEMGMCSTAPHSEFNARVRILYPKFQLHMTCSVNRVDQPVFYQLRHESNFFKFRPSRVSPRYNGSEKKLISVFKGAFSGRFPWTAVIETFHLRLWKQYQCHPSNNFEKMSCSRYYHLL